MTDNEIQPDVSRDRRERRSRSTVKKQPTCSADWTVKEKRDLLAAIKKHGWKNYPEIAEDIGTKTRAQVKRFIELKHHSARRISYLHAERDRTPIELWIEKADRLVGNKQDYSLSLGKAMHLISKWEDHPIPNSPEEPNYSNIYEYLSMLLRGELPPELSSVDSTVVLHMIEVLASLIKTIPLNEEMEVIEEIGKMGLKMTYDNSNSPEANAKQEDSQKPKAPVSLLISKQIKVETEDSRKESHSEENKQTSSSNSKPTPANNSFNPFNIPVSVLGQTCVKIKTHPLFRTNSKHD